MDMGYKSDHQKRIVKNLLENQDLNRVASHVNSEYLVSFFFK